MAVNKVHHCFKPWILIYKVRISGAVGFKCSQARRVTSTTPGTRELTDESLSPLIFSSKKNMNTSNAKAPPKKGCAPRIKIQELLLLAFFVFLTQIVLENMACLHAYLFNCVRLFDTLWTIARQDPLSMEFSRQEYWSGLPFPSPRDLPHPRMEPGCPELQVDSLPAELLTGHQ